MKLNNEVRKSLLNAADIAEVMEVCKNAGIEVDEKEAQRILDEVAHKKESTGKELSLDELESVSGGGDRDWLTEGCAATVEAGSTCWTNDACSICAVIYDNEPSTYICPDCGGGMYHFDWDGIYRRFKCQRCGALFIDKVIGELERV